MNLKNIPTKTFTFLKEVNLEIKKVNWLTREELIKYTLIVVGVSVAAAIYLGGVDFLVAAFLNNFILK